MSSPGLTSNVAANASRFRCNQVLRNLDAFAQTFDVKPGDGMWLDPAERVTIW